MARALSLLVLVFFPLLAQAQGFREKGLAFLGAGRFDDARAFALDTLQVNPNDIEAEVLLCQSLVLMGRSADAVTYASRYYQTKRDARLAELIGEGLYAQGVNEPALKWFQLYLDAFSEGPWAGAAYFHSGEIYIRLGHYGHADIAFTAALQYEPSNARWRARLAWAQERTGDLRQALANYEAALRIDPRLEDATVGRSRILVRLRG
jgi:tetratricopeptide (TPR) repeat protein